MEDYMILTIFIIFILCIIIYIIYIEEKQYYKYSNK